jgi:hypothetical protein
MPATQKQIDYIDILCNEVGLDTRVKKLDFVSNLLGWWVPYLDEIAIPEASKVIEKLKEMIEILADRESDKPYEDY